MAVNLSKPGRPTNKKTLGVWMNGILAGYWTFSPASGRSGHSFSYAPSWVEHPLGRPISLSMPLTRGEEPFTGDVVEFYFDNLLPDSVDIRRRLASKFSTGSTHAFQLLEKIGRDCVGALQLLPIDTQEPDVMHIDAEPLFENDIERILDNAVSGSNFSWTEEDELRISIAGAQEKTALLWHNNQWCRPRGATPTTHILKLPMGEVGGMRADFSTSVENEWLCGKIMEAFCIPVAESYIERFGRHKALVVRRFDRRLMKNGWWARLPQEDFCQVTGLPPECKYEEKGGPGISTILDILRGSDQASTDRENFLTAQLIFWLLAAPDGHAKNFSISIGPRGKFQLTPLYDILSAWPIIGKGARQLQWQKVKIAMALHSKNSHYHMAEIQRRHWNAVAKDNGLGIDFEGVIQHIIDLTPIVIDNVAAKIPYGFPSVVSEHIFDGMRLQLKRLSSR